MNSCDDCQKWKREGDLFQAYDQRHPPRHPENIPGLKRNEAVVLPIRYLNRPFSPMFTPPPPDMVHQFTFSELKSLTRGYPWKLQVSFSAYKQTPQGPEAFVFAQPKYTTPAYAVKLEAGQTNLIQTFSNEDKYGGAYRVFGQSQDINNGFPIAIGTGEATTDKYYDNIYIAYANQGQRSVVKNAAGPIPPPPIPGKPPLFAASNMGTEAPDRRLWLVNAIGISALGNTPNVKECVFNVNATGGNPGTGDFVWASSIATWSYPQSDTENRYGFDSNGYFTDNPTITTVVKVERPAIATSVLATWDGSSSGGLRKVILDRLSHAAWAQPDQTPDCSAIAIPAPTLSSSINEYQEIILANIPPPPPNVPSPPSPPVGNKSASLRNPGRLVCGPGLVCTWKQPTDVAGNITSGFYWNVRATASMNGLTGVLITDHDPDRIWRSVHTVTIHGPVDNGKVK